MRSFWWKEIDPVLAMLFCGLVLFTAILIWVTSAFKEDGQIFQVISGLVTGFAGAFFGRMKPQDRVVQPKPEEDLAKKD